MQPLPKATSSGQEVSWSAKYSMALCFFVIEIRPCSCKNVTAEEVDTKRWSQPDKLALSSPRLPAFETGNPLMTNAGLPFERSTSACATKVASFSPISCSSFVTRGWLVPQTLTFPSSISWHSASARSTLLGW